MEYKTKDSGERQKYSTGMVRDLQRGKPRFDLIIPLKIPYKETTLYRWAMLMERGMDKYGYRNWELAKTTEEQNRFKDSAFRHFIQWFCGEEDEDHLAATFFNMTAYEYTRTRRKQG